MIIGHGKLLALIFIISFGIFFRIYNLNFENLWYDEIISFWVANPFLSYEESFKFHKSIESTSIIYNLFLKNYYQIFEYNVFNGRFLSALFGILSIFSIVYLDKRNNKNNSYLFSAFLISFNIFLISYSQELRNYTLFFFVTSLSLIFFFKYLENKNNLGIFFVFSIVLFINILVHPFGFLIFFSICFHQLLDFLSKYNYSAKVLTSLIIIFTLSIIFYGNLFYDEIFSTTSYANWMKNPSLSFYSNFYFSKYFGSRLVGGIFLIIFIYLIVKNFKIIIKNDFFLLLFIIVIFSYAAPLIFGYLIKPVINARYVMFNLIPIILLTSSLAFQCEKRIIKYTIVFILSFITLGNLFTEQTIKQLYVERIPSKPEYTKTIEFIKNSNTKYYSIKVENMKNNEYSIKAIKNYIDYLNQNIPGDNVIFNYEKNENKKTFWVICPQDINSKKCTLPQKFQKYDTKEFKNFNNINLKLIEK